MEIKNFEHLVQELENLFRISFTSKIVDRGVEYTNLLYGIRFDKIIKGEGFIYSIFVNGKLPKYKSKELEEIYIMAKDSLKK